MTKEDGKMRILIQMLLVLLARGAITKH